MALICLAALLTVLELLLASLFYPMPYRDSRGEMRYKSFPWMTWTIIALNVLVFLVWLVPDFYGVKYSAAGQPIYTQNYAKIYLYGYRETELHHAQSIGAFVTFTAIFMHGSFGHLFGNMLYLRVFGFRVEDACGPWRFLAYYLLAGMISNVCDTLLNPIHAQESMPSIGASGAISGVMGAYLILFYGERITCIWGVGSVLRFLAVIPIRLFSRRRPAWWRGRLQIPSALLLFPFLIMETVPSISIIQSGYQGQVGHLAHVMGFLAGLTIFLFIRKDMLMRYVGGRAL
ncbi:MAG: rhomboid family intramembrane serine protease [Chloroflexi bacterium]|nr:rhomboid family intramembrane serine protease [Chloroflexota bacterium]